MDACYGLPGKDSPSLADCMSGNHFKIFFSNLFSVIFFPAKPGGNASLFTPGFLIWLSPLLPPTWKKLFSLNTSAKSTEIQIKSFQPKLGPHVSVSQTESNQTPQESGGLRHLLLIFSTEAHAQ